MSQDRKTAAETAEPRVLAAGRYLTLIDKGGWEYVTRPHVTGIVVIVAFTPDEKLVLVEQYRAPVNKRVLELPAGLVGDIEGQRGESMQEAAARELVEETGYAAAEMVLLAEGPISVGISDETVSFFLARGLTRVGDGGGDETEAITVYSVPPPELGAFLAAKANDGVPADPKIYAGMFLAAVALAG